MSHIAVIIGQFRLGKISDPRRETLLEKVKATLEVPELTFVEERNEYQITNTNCNSHVYREDIDNLYKDLKPYFKLFDVTLWLLDDVQGEVIHHEGKN